MLGSAGFILSLNFLPQETRVLGWDLARLFCRAACDGGGVRGSGGDVSLGNSWEFCG